MVLEEASSPGGDEEPVIGQVLQVHGVYVILEAMQLRATAVVDVRVLK